ncbi:MAG: protein kinase [Proteobacteria bacterium]|nr:protein kinase [Pseudomonadota bacterium]
MTEPTTAETLRARAARAPLPPGTALSILRDVAAALAEAHARGVVHGDVRPERVMLASAETDVAALDFPGDETARGATGAPGYQAPELASPGATVDARADIYSWGVMAYELLAGEHPFARHGSPSEPDAAPRTEMPESLAERAWGVPDAVSELVMRCLQPSPESRPQTMAAVLEEMAEGQRVSTPMTTAEMRAAEAAEAIAKRPKTPPKRPRAPKPIPSATAEAHARSRAPWAIAAAIAAVIIGGLVLASHR